MATNPTPKNNDRSGDQQQPHLDQSRRDRFVYDAEATVFITHDPKRPNTDDDRGGDSTD